MLRIFGRHKFYLKNALGIEQAAAVDTLIFDKTGTITTNKESLVTFKGNNLSDKENNAIKNIIRFSNHPLNRMLYSFLPNLQEIEVTNFKETLGKGIEANVDGDYYKLGSASFLNAQKPAINETTIYDSVNNEIKGKYIFKNKYRKGVTSIFNDLAKTYKLSILSGDNDGEKEILEELLPDKTDLIFNQKPENKLKYIKSLQEKKNNVLMVGDGLNDAGALAQSNFGIAVAENTNVFSPACDAILAADKFEQLPNFLQLTKKTIKVIKISFVMSLMYNTVGMYFAITGQLSPLIAAILMPLSSISVVVLVTVLTNYHARKLK
jgi:Cu+-exporting ATPase